MDLKLLGSTFLLVFIAELGDKTQLATLSLAASASSKWAVFLGAALALVVTSAIAVLLGDAVARFVPAVWVRRAAGLAFVVLGALYLLSGGESATT